MAKSVAADFYSVAIFLMTGADAVENSEKGSRLIQIIFDAAWLELEQ